MFRFVPAGGAGGAASPGAGWARLRRWLAATRDAAMDAPRHATHDGDRSRAGHGSHALPSLANEFEAFYRDRERGVFGYLWRMTGDEQTANDLTQEVFLRAWDQFAKLRGYERPSAWLFRIATNLALNERRHQRVAGLALPLPDDPRARSDHAAGLAERAALRAALEGLPARQRAAIILREVYGYNCDEIAQTLAVSRAAAKMTLSRARQRLRELYLKEGAE
ncbi:MAG TPA: RNA polymerase sigma factor [Ktedonobacterales bacterium]